MSETSSGSLSSTASSSASACHTPSPSMSLTSSASPTNSEATTPSITPSASETIYSVSETALATSPVYVSSVEETASSSGSFSSTPSMSPSASDSYTATSSLSTSPSQSPSASPSSSESPAASPSYSSSADASASNTFTSSTSDTPSGSASTSYSVSSTGSYTSSGSGSASSSSSGSTSCSPTSSPSTSLSSSGSASCTASSTMSESSSLSYSVSSSDSSSSTPTAAVSASLFSSASGSATFSESVSSSSSVSFTPSYSSSVTVSMSFTPSYTPSLSSSLSTSISTSSSSSATPGVSTSLASTASNSIAASNNHSVSNTGSLTLSPSATNTNTGSRTASAGASVSNSGAASSTITESPSGSPSITPPVSIFSSLTVSYSASQLPSLSLSVSLSTSVSPSAVGTHTITASPSASRSASLAPSMSVSPSVTPSSRPRNAVIINATQSMCSYAPQVASSSSTYIQAVGCPIDALNAYALTLPSSRLTANHIVSPRGNVSTGLAAPGQVALLSCAEGKKGDLEWGSPIYMCDVDGVWRAATMTSWYASPSKALLTAGTMLSSVVPVDALTLLPVALQVVTGSAAVFVLDCDARVKDVRFSCLDKSPETPPLPQATVCNGTLRLRWTGGSLAPPVVTALNERTWCQHALASHQAAALSDFVASPIAEQQLVVVLGVWDAYWTAANVTHPNNTTLCAGGTTDCATRIALLHEAVLDATIISPFHPFGSEESTSVSVSSLLAVLIPENYAAGVAPDMAAYVSIGIVSRVMVTNSSTWIYGRFQQLVINASLQLSEPAVFGTMLPSMLSIRSTCAAITLVPFVQLANKGVAAVASGQTLLLSDVWQPSTLDVHLSAPPYAGEVLTIDCQSDILQGIVQLSPATTTLDASSFARLGTTSFVPIQARVNPIPLSAAGGAPVIPMRITCLITSSAGGNGTYPNQTTIAIAATVFRAKYPLFRDVIVEPRAGGLRSSWSSRTFALPLDTNGSMIALTQLPVDAWYSYFTAAADVTVGFPVFSVTLLGSTNMTLVADQGNPLGVWAGFGSGTAVYINNLACHVSWVSEDGRFMRIETPPYATICPSPPDCPASSITIIPRSMTPTDVLRLLEGNGSSVQAVWDGEIGIAPPAACPPLCPADGSSLPFYTVFSSESTTPSLATSPFGTRVVSSSASVSSALQYTLSCSADGFVSSDSGVCLNASDPTSQMCAFGTGEACSVCPRGAVCPGGFRAWPQPGFFTSSQTSGGVTPCDAPAAQRCLGWSAALNAVQCGVGYKQGSIGCRACSFSFYKDGATGACKPCDSPQDPWTLIRPVLTFMGGVAAAAVAMLLVALINQKVRGGSVAWGVRLTRVFAIKTAITLQIVVTVGRQSAGGLPASLQSMYKALAFLQFQGATVPPACLAVTTSPFIFIQVQFGLVVGLLLILLLNIRYMWSTTVDKVSVPKRGSIMPADLTGLDHVPDVASPPPMPDTHVGPLETGPLYSQVGTGVISCNTLSQISLAVTPVTAASNWFSHVGAEVSSTSGAMYASLHTLRSKASNATSPALSPTVNPADFTQSPRPRMSSSHSPAITPVSALLTPVAAMQPLAQMEEQAAARPSNVLNSAWSPWALGQPDWSPAHTTSPAWSVVEKPDTSRINALTQPGSIADPDLVRSASHFTTLLRRRNTMVISDNAGLSPSEGSSVPRRSIAGSRARAASVLDTPPRYIAAPQPGVGAMQAWGDASGSGVARYASPPRHSHGVDTSNALHVQTAAVASTYSLLSMSPPAASPAGTPERFKVTLPRRNSNLAASGQRSLGLQQPSLVLQGWESGGNHSVDLSGAHKNSLHAMQVPDVVPPDPIRSAYDINPEKHQSNDGAPMTRHLHAARTGYHTVTAKPSLVDDPMSTGIARIPADVRRQSFAATAQQMGLTSPHIHIAQPAGMHGRPVLQDDPAEFASPAHARRATVVETHRSPVSVSAGLDGRLAPVTPSPAASTPAMSSPGASTPPVSTPVEANPSRTSVGVSNTSYISEHRREASEYSIKHVEVNHPAAPGDDVGGTAMVACMSHNLACEGLGNPALPLTVDTTSSTNRYAVVHRGRVGAHAKGSRVENPRGNDTPTPKPKGHKRASVVHYVFVALSILYASVTTSAVSWVWCQKAAVTVRAYLDLAGDGHTLLVHGITQPDFQLRACMDDPSSDECAGAAAVLAQLVQVSVVKSEPSIVCYEGGHVLAACLAWALVLIAVVYPLLSWWGMERMVQHAMVHGRNASVWKAALAAQTEYHAVTKASSRWPCAITRAYLVSCCSRRSAVPELRDDVAQKQSRRTSWIDIGEIDLDSDALASQWMQSNNRFGANTPATGPESPRTAAKHRADQSHAIMKRLMDREASFKRTKTFASFFEADFRPSCYYFQHIHMLFLLAVIVCGNVNDHVIVFASTVALAAGMCVINWWVNPFKKPVFLPGLIAYGVLVLGLMEAVVNYFAVLMQSHATTVATTDEAADKFHVVFTLLCYVAMGMSLTLLCVILLAYVWELCFVSLSNPTKQQLGRPKEFNAIAGTARPYSHVTPHG